MKKGRMTLILIVCVVAVPTLAQILPGIEVGDMAQTVIAGAVLGFAYILVRPILRLLTFPLGCLTFGAFHFILDVGLLYACAHYIGGFAIGDPLMGLLAAIFINAVIAIVGGFR